MMMDVIILIYVITDVHKSEHRDAHKKDNKKIS